MTALLFLAAMLIPSARAERCVLPEEVVVIFWQLDARSVPGLKAAIDDAARAGMQPVLVNTDAASQASRVRPFLHRNSIAQTSLLDADGTIQLQLSARPDAAVKLDHTSEATAAMLQLQTCPAEVLLAEQ
ncbi:MAG: hypothetical protein ACI8S6_003961 [Myxococcota bacterium]|jgi:hypothetical protein